MSKGFAVRYYFETDSVMLGKVGDDDLVQPIGSTPFEEFVSVISFLLETRERAIEQAARGVVVNFKPEGEIH